MNKQEQRTFGITENLLKKPVPKFYGAGKHKVQLAYITPAEAELLADLDLHNSNPPNPGPGGIPNFNDPGKGISGAAMSAAERGDFGSKDVRASGMSLQQAKGIQAGALAAAAGKKQSKAFQDIQRMENEKKKQAEQEKLRVELLTNKANELIDKGYDPTKVLGSSSMYELDQLQQNVKNKFLAGAQKYVFDPLYDYGAKPLYQTMTTLNPNLFAISNVVLPSFNFNPTFDEDDQFIDANIFGGKYTGLYNHLNPDNPAYDFTEEMKDEFVNAIFDPAPDTTKGYTINQDISDDETANEELKNVLNKYGVTSVYNALNPASEQNRLARLDTNNDGKIDGFDFAGDNKGGGPADVYIPSSTNTTSGAAASGTGTGTATVDTTDYQGIYNNFSADQKATADKIMAMDEYDLPYAVDYVRMGGPLF